MRHLAAWLLAWCVGVSVPASALAMDLHPGLQLIIAPAIGSVHIDRKGAPAKQLDLGMQLGLARGAEVLWGGAVLGIDYLEVDHSLLTSLVLRGQVFILGAEMGPMLVSTRGRTGTGMRARAFIGPFYLGGSTMSATGSPRNELTNAFDIGASFAFPVLIKANGKGTRPPGPRTRSAPSAAPALRGLARTPPVLVGVLFREW